MELNSQSISEYNENDIFAVPVSGMIFSPCEGRFDRITDLACKFFKVPLAKISLNNHAQEWFPDSSEQNSAESSSQDYFCNYANKNHEALIISDTRKYPNLSADPLVHSEPGIRFYAGYPLNFNGKLLGTLCIMDNEPRTFDDSEIDILKSLAALVEDEIKISMMDATQTELIKQLDEARREALIDPMTKTWNRRGLSQIVPAELDRCIRNNSPVTMMIVDIDKFKNINDTFGHHIGDLVIQEVANQLRNAIRPHDILIRFGGDEFVLFFGNTAEETGVFLGKRILNKIKNTSVKENNNEIKINLSIGITSTIPDKNTSIEDLVKSADTALYSAKTEGRCCSRSNSF